MQQQQGQDPLPSLILHESISFLWCRTALCDHHSTSGQLAGSMSHFMEIFQSVVSSLKTAQTQSEEPITSFLHCPCKPGGLATAPRTCMTCGFSPLHSLGPVNLVFSALSEAGIRLHSQSACLTKSGNSGKCSALYLYLPSAWCKRLTGSTLEILHHVSMQFASTWVGHEKFMECRRMPSPGSTSRWP